MPDRRPLFVNVDEDLLVDLRSLGLRTRRPLTEMVPEALRLYLEREVKKEAKRTKATAA